jgi:type III secretory pathway component EscU
MRWFKVAAIAAGVLIAFLVISSIIGLLMDAAIVALLVATVVLAVKVVSYRKQVAWSRPDSEIRHDRRDADDELARLRREMDQLRREMGS